MTSHAQSDSPNRASPDRHAPIGVFDSGVGGLSVLADIRALLPHEHFLYVADSGFAPYGDKPPTYIAGRSVAITRFLIAQGAKAIVVACNTATSAAVGTLRGQFTVPIVAMEPAVKPAVATSKSGVIGVLATTRTLASENLAQLKERFGAEADILLQACPGLVERVEACDLKGGATRQLLEGFVKPLIQRGADTLVLGCTHYPFLIPLLQDIAGPAVTIIDPGPAVARELRRRLEMRQLLSDSSTPGRTCYWTSADPDHLKQVVKSFYAEDIEVETLPAA